MATIAQEEPHHPFWDLKRYVGNLERGFEEAFFLFLNGEKPRHVFVAQKDVVEEDEDESEEDSNGIFDL